MASDLRDQDFFSGPFFEGSDLQNGVDDHPKFGRDLQNGVDVDRRGGRATTSLSHPIAIKITPYMPPPLWGALGAPGGPLGAPGGPWGPMGALGPMGPWAPWARCAAGMREAQFTLVPPQRGVAILGVCACESGPAVPPDFPHRPSRARAVPCTWPLCGSHTEAVWQPHRGCGAATQAGRPVRVDIGSRGRRATFFSKKTTNPS